MPAGPGIRVDSGVAAGSVVSPYYDPLLAKLAVWAPDRPSAVRRLLRALGECSVIGLDTNLGFLLDLAAEAGFQRGEYDTDFVARHPDLGQGGFSEQTCRDLAAALAALSSLEEAAPPRAASGAVSPWVLVERARLR
jgi:acetyl/propionyl-CoA carboxylase alpha subunit